MQSVAPGFRTPQFVGIPSSQRESAIWLCDQVSPSEEVLVTTGGSEITYMSARYRKAPSGHGRVTMSGSFLWMEDE